MFRAVPVSISVVALVGCGTPTACPAVLHGASLTIRLADGLGRRRAAERDCPVPERLECGFLAPEDLTVLPQPSEVPVPPPGSASMPTPEPSPETGGTTQELDDGEATYVPDGPREGLVVTVHGRDGVLIERTVAPDWVRIGGSAERGGPMEAEVVVRAP